MSVGSWKSGRIFQRSILGVIREIDILQTDVINTPEALEAALELRVRVFVDEQRVPPRRKSIIMMPFRRSVSALSTF